VLSPQDVAVTGRENDRLLVLYEGGLVEEDAAAVPACVFGVVESLVGAGEKRACDFAGGSLSEADADGKGNRFTRNGKFADRLLDTRGDGEGL
jgi:hypothetical protein